MQPDLLNLYNSQSVYRRATGWAVGVRFQGEAREIFFSLHNIRSGSEVHPASYPMGTSGSFRADKAASA
jgi:hypothetical protein